MTAWQAVWVLILAGVLLAPLGLWLARDRDAAVDWTAVFQRIGQPDPLLDGQHADVQRAFRRRLAREAEQWLDVEMDPVRPGSHERLPELDDGQRWREQAALEAIWDASTSTEGSTR